MLTANQRFAYVYNSLRLFLFIVFANILLMTVRVSICCIKSNMFYSRGGNGQKDNQATGKAEPGRAEPKREPSR